MSNIEEEKRKARICEWREEDRPRERFMRLGAAALTSAELLAILIGSGNAHETAVGLMQRIVDDCEGSLIRLGKRSIEQLPRYEGIGPVKAITILAACELGKRRIEETLRRTELKTSRDIYEYMRLKLMDMMHERAYVLLLGARLCLLDCVCISEGGISQTAVDVRRVLREALLCSGCTAIVLCHNHPSGNAAPSRSDDHLTEELFVAARTVKIPLIDHIIVADGDYYSYADEGKIIC